MVHSPTAEVCVSPGEMWALGACSADVLFDISRGYIRPADPALMAELEVGDRSDMRMTHFRTAVTDCACACRSANRI